MNATTAYLLYLVFALGAGGIYFLLPRTRGARPLVAAVIGTGALVALMLVIGLRLVNPGATSGCFYLFALIAIGSAARVVTHPKPVYSALYFVLTVIAVASLLVLLQAEFLAVALIIIYAGAILVTYLFVIMLAQQGGAPSYDRSAREPLLAVLTGFVLMAAVAGRAIDLPPSRVLRTGAVTVAAETTQTRFTGGNTNSVGEAIMTRYIVVLELAGVLLLVSMVGAIALAKKKLPPGAVQVTKPVLGRIGREAEPY